MSTESETPETMHGDPADDALVDLIITKLQESPAIVDRIIARLDAAIGRQVETVLHHPKFQAVEAARLGLQFVHDRVGGRENVQSWAVHCTKEELASDLENAPDVTTSGFFKLVYEQEYGQHGGTPYGAVFICMPITPNPKDVELLRRASAVASMSHAVLFVQADTHFFGVDFDGLTVATDIAAIFNTPKYAAWNALREEEDSKYLGVVVPRMLLRAPHRDAEDTIYSPSSFTYNESVVRENHVWGSGTYALAVRLAESHIRYRTPMGMQGSIEPAVREFHEAMGPDFGKSPVDVSFSLGNEEALASLGFIPLTSDPEDSTLRISSVNSLQAPKSFGTLEGGDQATLNYLLATQIPYLLLACRFAHDVKLFQREQLGSDKRAEELEKLLTERIRRHVDTKENPSLATRLRYPLRGAKVQVTEVDGEPGWYRMAVLIRPHMRYLHHAEFELAIAGRLPRSAPDPSPAETFGATPS